MHRLIAFSLIVLSCFCCARAQSPGPFGFGLTSCQHDGDSYTANREELVRVFFQENGVSVVNAVDQLYPDAEDLRERFSDDRPEVAQLFADVVSIKQAIPGMQLKVSLPEGQTIEDLAWDIYNKQPTPAEIKKFAAAKGKQDGRKTLVQFLTIVQAEGKQTVRTGWLEQNEKALQDQVEADTVQIIGPDGKPLGADVVQLAIVIEHHWEVDVATGKSLDNRIKLAVGGAYTTKPDQQNTSEPKEEGAESPKGEQAGDNSVLHQLLYQRQWTPMFRP